MSSSLERDILAHLQDYLSGTIDLDQLKDWLIPATWSVEPESDPAAMSLAYEIHMALADYSSKVTTESELRETLFVLLPEHQLVLSRPNEHR